MNINQTTNYDSGISQRQAAIVAGVSSLIMFVAAMLAEFYARQNLIIPGDAAATAQSIRTNELSFRIGLFSFLIILICDMLAAWAYYIILAPVNKHLSLLGAWFRLVYTAVFGMSLLNLVSGFRLLTNAHYATVLETDQLYNQALLLFNAFDDGWAIGFVFFGFHLLFLGYLVFKSNYIPRMLGIILMIASVAYLADNFAKLILSNYENYKTLFMVILVAPSIIGELGLALWLLVKGGKTAEKHLVKN